MEGAQAHGGGECDGECAATHLPSLSSPLTMADAPAASAAVTSLARAAAPGRPLLGGAAAAEEGEPAVALHYLPLVVDAVAPPQPDGAPQPAQPADEAQEDDRAAKRARK